MKASKFAKLENGKIVWLYEYSRERELEANQIPLTSNELALLKAVNGDLENAKNIIRDIQERIATAQG